MWFSRLLFGHWIRKHFAVPHSFIILCSSFFICWMWLLLLFYLFIYFCLHSTFSMDSSLWMNTSIRLRSTLPFWNMVHVFVDVFGCACIVEWAWKCTNPNLTGCVEKRNAWHQRLSWPEPPCQPHPLRLQRSKSISYDHQLTTLNKRCNLKLSSIHSDWTLTPAPIWMKHH